MADVAPQSVSFEPYKEKKGEEYMNEKQKEHFIAILNAWKDDLMHEVDRTVDHMKDRIQSDKIAPETSQKPVNEEYAELEYGDIRKIEKHIDST